MNIRAHAVGAVLAAVCLQAGIAGAQNKSGEAVYRTVCALCHATGVAGAPRFGEAADWQARLAVGQAALTAEAWLGVRRMPARGGRDDLRLEEFARGVAFMARAVDDVWQDPDDRMMAVIADEEKKRRTDPNRN